MPAVKRRADSLAFDGWETQRQQTIVDRGGCGSVRCDRTWPSKYLLQIRRLRYIRQRIPAMR